MARSPYALTLLALSLGVCAAARPALALETDQFTVPDSALPDLGPEVDVYVAATIFDLVQELNERADGHGRAARAAAWPLLRDYHRGRAARYRSEDLLAKRVYDALAGTSLPECRIEQWVRRHRFRVRRQEPGRGTMFHMTTARGVYGDSAFSKPLLLVDLSPTINVHGSYVGLDKLGHLFQQGYEYHQEFRREERRGGGERRAAARAVRLGVAQERGVYGEALVGVYSNADLAANYAGMKFYLNLTRDVCVGGETLPPVLLRDGRGNWVFNPHRRPADLLRPFVGDHFNEALNPSRFRPGFRETVQARLRRRAQKLIEFYDTTADRERERMVELSTWHGEKYGHCGFERLVTIADNCPPPRSAPSPADVPDAAGAVVAGATLSGSPPPAPAPSAEAPPSGGRSAPPRLSTR